MSVHTFHPDSHEHGLADGCPRCEEHAAHPFESLDQRNLRVLIARERDGLPPRSENEARAMEIVGTVRRQAERLTA